MQHRCTVCRRYAEAGQPHNCTPPQPIDLRSGAPVLVSEPYENRKERAA